MLKLKNIVTGLFLLGLSSTPGLILPQGVSFTVADSIQMVHFNDPNGRATHPVWNISPDGSKVLLVTTKGIVSANVVESTLWTIDLRAAAKYLEDAAGHNTPSPKEVFTVRGQLRADQSNSYGSLITNCRWSIDSKSVYMLVEQKNSRIELDKIDVLTKCRERISPAGYSVSTYEVDRRGVLYSAEHLQRQTGPSKPANSDVMDTVTGTSFSELLWPSTSVPRRILFRSDDGGHRAIAPAPAYASGNSFSISPDGKKVVSLVPVQETPIGWKWYLAGDSNGASSLYSADTPNMPLLEWDVVDLNSGLRRSLFDSPSGTQAAGYFDQTHVVWSSSGDHVLVTNTFLPFDRQSDKEREARRRPCAAAYVGIRGGAVSCLVFTRSSKGHGDIGSWAISGIKFGGTDHDVIVNLEWYGRYKTECYSLAGGVWSEMAQSTCKVGGKVFNDTNRAPVRLNLVQSLNDPPTLWAEDAKRSRRLQVWDPNPQIARTTSGVASVYHWLDKEKREWTGGLILPHGYESGERYPLVIQTHGFNSEEFLVDGSFTTADAARPLAAAGFVVLQIEDNHEQTVTLGELKIHVGGFLSAIDVLAKSGLIDPKRVGIVGFSRTCWYVEESLLEAPEHFAAAVLADGMDASYVQYLLTAPDPSRREYERYYGGAPIGKGLAEWIKLAPDFRLSELTTPLRLQAIGPPSLMVEWEIYASLRVQNKPVDMLYLPKGQHVLQNPAERLASEQGDVDWFRFWLKGEEDHDPAKKTQYARWEKLREEGSRPHS